MFNLDSNALTLLNDIIYKIYNVQEFDQMRLSVLSSLRFLIPCVGGSSYRASQESPYRLSDGVQVGIQDNILDLYINEFQVWDQTAWKYATSVSKAYNESAFIQEQSRLKTPFYKAIYASFEGYYQITLTIMHKGVFLGTVSLFRNKGDHDFNQEDLYLLELLGPHLGVRFHQLLKGVDIKIDVPSNLKHYLAEYRLTARESDVLHAILREKDNQVICHELCISPYTLNKHLANIYKKCHVNSRVELLHLAMKR